MNRYAVEFSYFGTNYSGWQLQNNAVTVQGEVEACLSKIYNNQISVVACGRTDAGVHARQSFFHFDYSEDIDLKKFVFVMNKVLPSDIAIHSISKVSNEFHARFDARSRSYKYYISNIKLPFLTDQYWHYRYAQIPSLDKLNEAAQLLLNYNEFFPFSKTNTDVKTYKCKLTKAKWTKDKSMLIFEISSDRFLRGMVRLIVGMCVNYATDKISLDVVKSCMDKQVVLPRAYSVPAEGLFLVEVNYPD